MSPDISVILPIRNASSSIESLLPELLSFSTAHPEYEFIFASDASDDGTPDIIRHVLERSGNHAIRVVHYEKHQGKGGVIRATFPLCRGSYTIFTDGDLAYDLALLMILRDVLNRSDMAVASRRLGGDNSLHLLTTRGFVSFVYNRYTAFILALPQSDIQAGLKGFRTEVARQLFKHQRLSGFAFDAELLFLANKYHYSVEEFPAQVRPEHRADGSIWRIGLRSAIMFCEVLRVRLYDMLGYY